MKMQEENDKNTDSKENTQKIKNTNVKGQESIKSLKNE